MKLMENVRNIRLRKHKSVGADKQLNALKQSSFGKKEKR